MEIHVVPGEGWGPSVQQRVCGSKGTTTRSRDLVVFILSCKATSSLLFLCKQIILRLETYEKLTLPYIILLSILKVKLTKNPYFTVTFVIVTEESGLFLESLFTFDIVSTTS